MYYKAMPVHPVGHLRTHQTEIIATLHDSPILLTNRGESTGILVHPQLWNQLVEEIEQYRQMLSTLQPPLSYEAWLQKMQTVYAKQFQRQGPLPEAETLPFDEEAFAQEMAEWEALSDEALLNFEKEQEFY